MPALGRARLDVMLLARGLAESREKAQALIMAGRVRVDGQPATKAGAAVRGNAVLEVSAGPEHVGRGALKLLGALDAFALSPEGKIAVDVGASTGGFTEILLARGALRVYAVDVGRGQLHERVRDDTRVAVREGVNARELSAAQVPELCDLATVDVSFISVLKILTPLRGVLRPGADAAVLVKPQFEVGRRQVCRGGIVREPERHEEALHGVAAAAQADHGYGVRGACPSPITGSEGNREFFLHLQAGAALLSEDDLRAQVQRAVRG